MYQRYGQGKQSDECRQIKQSRVFDHQRRKITLAEGPKSGGKGKEPQPEGYAADFPFKKIQYKGNNGEKYTDRKLNNGKEKGCLIYLKNFTK